MSKTVPLKMCVMRFTFKGAYDFEEKTRFNARSTTPCKIESYVTEVLSPKRRASDKSTPTSEGETQ